MKKSKFITGLSAAFISAMALMSCSSLLKAKDGVILTIDGVPYTAEDLFNDQKTPAAEEAKFNAIYKVAVRAYAKKLPEGDASEIERNTKIKISEQKAVAQSNADKNGTSYNEEWKKILDSNGVDDEAGLYSKFEYDLQKEKFENDFYDENYEKLRNTTTGGKIFGDDFKDYFTSKQPYHMKHILVKVGASADDNTTATISKEEAIKLHNVITSLAEGNKSFERISEMYSDDDTAKKTGGSLGIMSRDTSFVDDFKLGTYLYEAFYGSSTEKATTDKYASKDASKELFDIEDDVEPAPNTAAYWANQIRTLLNDPTSNATATSQEAVGVIPYEAAVALGEDDYTNPLAAESKKGLADFEWKDQPLLEKAGIAKDQFKDKYLPRNVIFNKYFNKHNIMVIAPTTLPTINAASVYAETGSSTYIIKDGEGSKRSSLEDSYTGTYASTYANLPGFASAAKNNDQLNFKYDGTNNSVLRDNNGRIVLVFRSGTGDSSSNDAYQGIHFVVIERSPFITNEYDDANETDYYKTPLDDYYTVYYPEQTGIGEKHHPTYNTYIPHPGPEEKNEWKHTFVNYFMDDVEPKNKKERAETVKSELKKCDNLNTHLYEYLVSQNIVQFTERGEAMKKSVANWIEITRDDTRHQTSKSWNENWQKYYYSLKAKQDERKEYPGDSVVSKLIPEACMVALTQYTTGGATEETYISNLKHMFGAGGVWHE